MRLVLLAAGIAVVISFVEVVAALRLVALYDQLLAPLGGLP